jgi:hypothetical protein
MNDIKEKRTKTIKIKVTPYEYQFIREQATLQNLTVSSYVRGNVLSTPHTSDCSPMALGEINNKMQSIRNTYHDYPELAADLDDLNLAINNYVLGGAYNG